MMPVRRRLAKAAVVDRALSDYGAEPPNRYTDSLTFRSRRGERQTSDSPEYLEPM